MRASAIYNFISVLFLILTIVVIVGVGVLLSSPPPEPEEVAELPTVAIVPTATITPTLTPSDTPLPPTFTPTPTETFTPSPAPTDTPTVTPSATITDTPGPTLTPSLTFTPSISPTFTPSLTPTGPTATFTPSESPFPFDQRDAVSFTSNFANSAGCQWQGIGGQVLALNGEPFTGNLQVRVFNNRIDRTTRIGSNSLYGPVSGWEIGLEAAPTNQLYFVQLETINGTAVSPQIQVQFPGTCEQNTAILTFVQRREL